MSGIVPVRGFKGYYITDEGVVYSERKNRAVRIKERIKESSSGLVYKYVWLTHGYGVSTTRLVHRLVYESFNDITLKRNQQVFFKNFWTLDCRLDNLSLDKPMYKLQEQEKWVKGYEGEYFTNGDEVFSLKSGDIPNQILVSEEGGYKYFFVKEDGKTKKLRI